MLTKALLQHRSRNGVVKPRFVDVESPDLLAMAQAMVSVAEGSIGTDRDAIEGQLAACGSECPQPKIGAGLAKLTLDRMVFAEPTEETAALRARSFTQSARLLRGLPDAASEEDYERELQPLVSVRDSLYADHPGNRPLLEWKQITAPQLLQRYNLAQVQGLVMHAPRVEVRAIGSDLLRVRRLLRWMKFCRLIADVRRTDDDWTLTVEGPAEILGMTKKYGLQLAQFVAAVPVLEWYEMHATVEIHRGQPLRLDLDHRSGLVSPHDAALGYVPPEITVIVDKLQEESWKVDVTPMPRAVGAGGFCVPDFACASPDESLAVFFEVFHPWHEFQLRRRLEDLRLRSDPYLVLAVDERLLRDAAFRADVEAHEQVMLYKGFPTVRRIRQMLDRIASK